MAEGKSNAVSGGAETVSGVITQAAYREATLYYSDGSAFQSAQAYAESSSGVGNTVNVTVLKNSMAALVISGSKTTVEIPLTGGITRVQSVDTGGDWSIIFFFVTDNFTLYWY